MEMMTDATPGPPRRTLLMLSPASLANYERCLRRGFEEEIPLHTTQGLLDHHHQHQGTIVVESVVVGEHEDAAMAVRQAMTAHEGSVVLVQLHGAHNENVVAFEVFKQITMEHHVQGDSFKVVLLVHRPEEVLERARHGLYDEAATYAMFRRADAVVLLGEAMLDAYARLCPRVCAIHHGFFNLVPPESIISKAQAEHGEPVAVVGSVTTWSDMRWISDVLIMHATYRANREWCESARMLFYVAGTFRPYTRIGDTRPIDEWAVLRTGSVTSDTVVVTTGKDLDQAFAECAFTDLPSFRLWLWRLSSQGHKVIVVGAPQPESSEVIELQSNLIDFNVQLYRELLCDFEPKVEYSGTLHERAGSSIPVVFDSPSMRDVGREGLHCITVAYGHERQRSQTEILPHPAAGLFYPPHYQPDFTNCLSTIVTFIKEPQQALAVRLANAHAAKCNSFMHVAREYLELFGSLL